MRDTPMHHAYILAVDTSCDDTSAAVTCGTTVLSNVVASQTELHKPYGGVFPTVAKLAHVENIDRTIQVALARAGTSLVKIDAVAVTIGPGLAPALEVGINAVKELATTYKKPLIPVNHIEGHVLSVLAQQRTRKTSLLNKNIEPQFPALSVIVSGGHTQFVLVAKIGEYKILGSTLDDAAGECLDKIGRMLNLGYPAGQIIEEFAKQGDRNAYPFPLPLTTVKTYDLSFSGMKTFARNFLERKSAQQPLSKEQIYDFCASAQYGVFRHICYKLQKLLTDLYTESLATGDTLGEIAEDSEKPFKITRRNQGQIKEIWLGGGVAANMTLRKMLRGTITKHNAWVNKKNLGSSTETVVTACEKVAKTDQQISELRVPYSKKLCADNAAMIGITAGFAQSATKEERQCIVEQEIDSIERKPQLKIGK